MNNNLKKTVNYFNFWTESGFENINPGRDWKISMMVSIILAILIFAANGYVLWKTLHVLDKKIVLDKTTTITVNKTALDENIVKIKEKEKRFSRGSGLVAADPSL